MSLLGFGSEHYVPALHWKAGEIRALSAFLQAGHDGFVTPLLQIGPPREREQNEKKARIPSKPLPYLDYVAAEIQKTIGLSRRAFVDARLFELGVNKSKGPKIDGLAIFFDTMAIKLTLLCPVLRLTDSANRFRAFKNCAQTKGIALRVAERQFRDRNSIEAMLSAAGVDETAVDLILDLENVDEKRSDIESLAKLIIAVCATKQEWKSITLLAGSYPKVLAKKSGVQRLERFDWQTYEKVRSHLERLRSRVPAFGDYGIFNPAAEPRSGSQAGGGAWPVLRYCAKDCWFVQRCVNADVPGSVSQYFHFAQSCATAPPFMGSGFSYGDNYVEERARGEKEKGGQAPQWIRVDTNHHITFVAHQVRNALPKAKPIDISEVHDPPGAQPETDDWEDDA